MINNKRKNKLENRIGNCKFEIVNLKFNESGSMLIWAGLVVAVLLALGAGFWYMNRSKSAPVAQQQIETQPLPSPSIDYSLVQQKYHLNESQLEILSHVEADGTL